MSGQTTSGHWVALLIGVVLLLTFVATTAAALMRVRRARQIEAALPPTNGLSDLLPPGMGASLWRCQALIAEAVVVRQRLSGEIDVETYQVRMTELARQASSERRPQRNT
ncbi:hypothetical protein [Mycobacterium nebraskense]|uniref:hypothetical protein n=1 Tax=Mycobacterium nebraskense TaxID=244292 RepID=UPI0023F451F9|nr:hypothetical protein [Mycobacterium nebraskense]